MLLTLAWCAIVAPLVIVFALVAYERLTFRVFRLAAKTSKSLGNTRFSAHKLPAQPLDAVVIGSGMGGLSCAAVLSQFGERVVVLEQHEVTGGGAHTFAVEGKTRWRFDSGLHITIPWHEQAVQLACGSTTAPVPFDKLVGSDGASDHVKLGEAPAGEAPLPIVTDVQLEAELCRRFPSHAAAIKRYLQLADGVQMRFGLLTASAILPSWLRRLLLRTPIFGLWRRWAAATARDALHELFPGKDEETCRLRSYLTGLWLDTGAPPSRGSFFMQTAVMGGWQRLGVSYPRGGPQITALAMVEAIESRGGAVFIRAPVSALLFDASGRTIGVRMSTGEEIRAKRVVSGLGYRNTEALIASGRELAGLSTATVPAPPRPLRTPQGLGFVMANIAMKGSAKELGISPASMWIQPAVPANGYDALEGELAYFADPLGCDTALIPVGLTFPSMKDARDRGGEAPTSDERVPEGGPYHTCQILVPARFEWFREHMPEWEDGVFGSRHAPPHVARFDQTRYDEVKKLWADRLTKVLHSAYPGTVGRVAFVDISTPLTIENYLKSGEGASIGLDVTPSRFVDEDEIAELDMRHPRVAGLWRAGQDYLMCGQVLACASGIMCALRMRGPIGIARFVGRALLLLLGSPDLGREKKAA